MNHTLPDNILEKLSEFITYSLALYFPKERWDDLERNIIAASKEFGYTNVNTFIERIISSPLSREHAEILASHLTISETYFWREPKTFDALEQKIIPELIRLRQKQDKRIRIWCAGCSGGEEPYSIAIALHKIIPDIKDWNISILATDINPKILKKAKAGEYKQWSFRGEPRWLKDFFFISKGNGQFEIIPEIKKMVRFEYLNLAEDVFPFPLNYTNAMDIIFCRNVLMYFTQERFRQVAKGFYNSLLQGGYLVVSASELSVHNFPDFTPVNVPGFVLYQKSSGKVKKLNKKITTSSFLEPDNFNIPKIQTFKIENKHIAKERIGEDKSELIIESKKPITEINQEENIDNQKIAEKTADEHIQIIKSFANKGELSKAIEFCKEALLIFKLDQRIYYLHSTILQENMQTEEAVTELKRAIYIDPDFLLPYFSLGNIYQKQGNLKAAKRCFQNAIDLLSKCNQDDMLFESDGLTAGRFKEIINASLLIRV